MCPVRKNIAQKVVVENRQRIGTKCANLLTGFLAKPQLQHFLVFLRTYPSRMIKSAPSALKRIL